MRIAQVDGDIYINDHMGNTSYLLPRPELYNLEKDPAESYDIGNRNPEMVQQLQATLDREMQTFPGDVQAAYAALKTRKASITTPPAATPRIVKGPLPAWAWEPPERR